MPPIRQRIELYWPKEKQYYPGVVLDYEPEKKKYHVKNDDEDTEDLDLSEEICRKLYTKPKETLLIKQLEKEVENCIQSAPSQTFPCEIIRDPPDPRFKNSSKEEIEGLLKKVHTLYLKEGYPTESHNLEVRRKQLALNVSGE